MEQEQQKQPKECRSQDVTALKTSASALRDEINLYMSKNDSNFAKEPAPKKSSEAFEKNKIKLSEVESKIMLFSPKILFQVI